MASSRNSDISLPEREKLIQAHSERSSMLTNDKQASPRPYQRDGFENETKSNFTSGFETLHLTANQNGDKDFEMVSEDDNESSICSFFASIFKSGSVPSSIFNLIIICLGSGTITVPYVFYATGPYLGSFLIIFMGVISYYTGVLIAYCAAMTGGDSFEAIAFKLYGINGVRITSFCNILCNLGFCINYVVLFKGTMPKALVDLNVTLPEWLDTSSGGQRTWDFIFCALLLPISLPRELNVLRFSSMLSFVLSLFIIGSIFGMSFTEQPSKPGGSDAYDFSTRMSEAFSTNRITLKHIFACLPYIIFSYMYQPCIPSIYHELHNKSMAKIKRVLAIGTTIATVAYIIVGIFGYATFSKRDGIDQLFENSANVLYYYTNKTVAVEICFFAILIIVLLASPFSILPTKDAIEELVMPTDVKFDFCKNFVVTFVLVAFCAAIGAVVSDINVPMSLLGPTTNTAIGFFIPIIFYIRYDTQQAEEDLQLENDSELFRLKDKEGRHKPLSTFDKTTAWSVFVIIGICSVLQLYSFISDNVIGK